MVSNLYDGLDVYALEYNPPKLVDTFPLSIEHNVPIPVQHVDDGAVLLCGGSTGSARLLRSDDGEIIQLLEHGGELSAVITLIS